MLVTCRTTRILVEATDRLGIASEDYLGPLGLERAPLLDTSRSVPWEVLTRMLDRVWDVLGRDSERMQAVGRTMTYVPAYDGLRWIAATAVSVTSLYEFASRWVGRANFPHVQLVVDVSSRDRMVTHVSLPEPHAACEAFFHITIGAMAELPALLGLPAAKIIEARPAPRSLDLVLALPRHRSLVSRAARALLARGAGRKRMEVLEEQRQALAEGLDAMQRARDELRILLEGLPDLVAIHDDGAIRFANRALVRALGGTDLVGRRVEGLVDPGSIEAFRAHESAGHLTQVRLLTKDGAPLIVELAPVTTVVFEGAPARLVVGRDVTERERLRQQLAAADRLASVGVLAAGVAHEINNPLGYVLNNLEVAKNQVAALPEPARSTEEALAIALEGVDRIRFIVRELLALARGDDGPRQPTDVSAVVESTLALARVEIARTAKLVTDLKPAPPALATVPRLAQIVLNLVLNALEAVSELPRGDGELVVRVGKSDDGRVALEVADNGTGVSPEAQPRVFEPFFTTKAPGDGTGLGLAITQRLVLELDGEIAFTTSPGHGTTFRVLLPAAG